MLSICLLFAVMTAALELHLCHNSEQNLISMYKHVLNEFRAIQRTSAHSFLGISRFKTVFESQIFSVFPDQQISRTFKCSIQSRSLDHL